MFTTQAREGYDRRMFREEPISVGAFREKMLANRLRRPAR
jgi:hypothetical protein